jgi:hypothetical protein
VPELALLTVTNLATDNDLPAAPVTYSLVNPPSGAVIDTNGVITWTPTEAQGPSTNTFTTVATDGSEFATNVFVVIVTEVNGPPVLNPLPDRLVHAGSVLALHCIGHDASGESNGLNFSLVGPPVPASLNAVSGAFQWGTTEADANTTNVITVRVTDDGTPPLSAEQSFVVTVVGRPHIKSIIVTNNLAVLTWSAVPDQNYRLEFADALQPTNWLESAADTLATGALATATNSIEGATVRFYRVRVQP